MKKAIVIFAIAASVLAVASCKNCCSKKAAAEPAATEVVAACDSCKACCDSCKAACDSCKACCDSCKKAE